MTPIKEQLIFASQRLKEAIEQKNFVEKYKWEGYITGLNYAKLWYESEQGKKELTRNSS